MPASRIAAVTAAATMRTCSRRPRCSGGRAGVRATPIASAPSPGSLTCSRANTVQCGGKGTLRAARHDDRNAFDIVFAEKSLEALCRVAAGEIVDAAVPLGLAEHGDHIAGVNAVSKQCLDAGYIVRAICRDAKDMGAARKASGKRLDQSGQVDTDPKTPPCIFTILMAAR